MATATHYSILLMTMTKTTKTKHAARNNITLWRILNFIEVYNVNQIFNALEKY
jgi:hypothetical protein